MTAMEDGLTGVGEEKKVAEKIKKRMAGVIEELGHDQTLVQKIEEKEAVVIEGK